MKNYPHPIIAREGWLFIVVSFVITGIVTYKWGVWSIPLWNISLFVLQFLRDPGRTVPDNEKAVLSPADGRIVVVEKTRDIYGERDALKISVFMNVFNVHSNRSPVDGKIEKVQYFPGKFVNADLDKASNGQMVTCVQVAGLIARRILCYVGKGDELTKGQRFGFIRFGSRVDVYLPLSAVPKVTVGEKVYATETILAELVDEQN